MLKKLPELIFERSQMPILLSNLLGSASSQSQIGTLAPALLRPLKWPVPTVPMSRLGVQSGVAIAGLAISNLGAIASDSHGWTIDFADSNCA